jgi:hypothetical protein
MKALAYRLAWPGIRRTDKEIERLLSTLPNAQAFELMKLIKIVRVKIADAIKESRAQWRAEQAELRASMCIDCKADIYTIREYFMVTKKVWKASGLKYDGGMLCVGCLEKRIGRELTQEDFPVVPLNADEGVWGEKSERLRQRQRQARPLELTP